MAEVRNASLDSLCELAASSKRFAVLSQDSIIDMVNDEIESVRLNAIHSLRKLSHHLTFSDDQLDALLGTLKVGYLHSAYSHCSNTCLCGVVIPVLLCCVCADTSGLLC